tara:strand:- start:578 stop:841 length:264 start_codon:yes stop_codon:yes gene_type:complete
MGLLSIRLALVQLLHDDGVDICDVEVGESFIEEEEKKEYLYNKYVIDIIDIIIENIHNITKNTNIYFCSLSSFIINIYILNILICYL